MTEGGGEHQALTVDVVRDIAALRALRSAWERLWLQDPASDVFASFDWLLNWWDHFGHGARSAALVVHDESELVAVPGGGWALCVCVVRDAAGDPLAILPLVRIQGVFKGARRGLLSTLVNSHSPRTGVVASRFGPDVTSALADALGDIEGWDVLLLEGLPIEGSRLAVLASALRARGLHAGDSGSFSHSYLRFACDWEEFVAGKKRNFRKHLWQSERSLKNVGEVRVERFAGAGTATEGMKQFLAVDGSSWKAEDGEAIGLNDNLRAYYVGICERLGPIGRAEVWTLSVGGELAAAYLCLRDHHARYTLKTSFSEAFRRSSRLSPSQVLLGALIREAWGKDGDGIDFVGRAQFVERWTDEVRRFEYAHFYRSRSTALRIAARDVLVRCLGRVRNCARRLRERLATLWDALVGGRDAAEEGRE